MPDTPTGQPDAPLAAPAVVRQTPWQADEVVLGGYVVEGELGEGVGGMGRVYRLLNPATGARFAVKRTKKLDEEKQRRFLIELLTWADLPPHVNLLPFRFFRTDGDEVFLFSDYADGGSLADWVREKRLTTLEQILDVAIQFAWGLHVAHSHGMVHQDVKPSNALMSAGGRVMVGDFGLSRSRRLIEDDGETAASAFVSHGGVTAAYCSPEQAGNARLNEQTDVWSWGVSVLELFVGAPPCLLGTLATEALEAWLREESPTVPMPAWLAEVLRRCFCEDLSGRWPTMAVVVAEMRRGWRETLKGEYPRELDEVPALPKGVVGIERRTTTGGIWCDPVLWLREALEMSGRDPAEAEGMMPPRGRWRHTHLMAEMVAMRFAARLFEESAEAGNARAWERLAFLCAYDRSNLHVQLEDRFGAVALYDRAIGILSRLVEQKGRAEFANVLADAFVCKANALYSLGEGRAALPLYDRASAILSRLVEQEGRAELANALANACMNKANALQTLGEGRAALPLYDRAIAIRERLVEQDGRAELANALANACMNKAVALYSLGEDRAALPLYDRAIAIRERLVEQDGRAELANDLANACTNKANALYSMGEGRSALPLYDRAIAILSRLVEQEGRAELTGDLVWARLTRAHAACTLGEPRENIRPLVLDCILILRQEIDRTGRADLQQVLAWAERAFADLL